VIGTCVVVWIWWIATGGIDLAARLPELQWWPNEVYGYHRYFIVFMIGCALVTLVVSKDWLLELLALSASGFLVSFYYVLYKAPDLALTQILVEAATLLLMLMFVMRVRRTSVSLTRVDSTRTERVGRAVLAIAAGVVTPVLLLLFQAGPTGGARVGDDILVRSIPEAKGSNAVNTTLVDFRGLDTFFEVLVLIVATLGCLGLLMRRRADAQPRPARARGRAESDVTPVGDSFILTAVVAFLFFLINVFAVYLFFRGHNLPGGGFIAGLCTALSFVMLGFVQGVEKLRGFLRVNPMRLATTGLVIAAVSGLFGLFGGGAFLEHYHPYFKNVPVLGDVYLGTPVLFDLGVFLVVVGVVLKIVFPLAKSVHGFRAFVVEEQGDYAASDEEPVEADARAVTSAKSGGKS
jgi:multisubunit Na+/H+ antiporter MnhB subunit